MKRGHFRVRDLHDALRMLQADRLAESLAIPTLRRRWRVFEGYR